MDRNQFYEKLPANEPLAKWHHIIDLIESPP